MRFKDAINIRSGTFDMLEKISNKFIDNGNMVNFWNDEVRWAMDRHIRLN